MGMFDSILKGAGNILGIGESSTEYARKAGEADIAEQLKGLNYLKGAIDPRLEREGEAANLLFNYYTGAPGVQQSVVDTAMSSPFYQSMIDQGRQAVGSTLSATGGLRGGMGPTSFAAQDQKVLQGAVNQNLKGLGYFAQPVNVNPIADMYSNIGRSQAGKYQAIGQAKQDKYGNMFDIGKTIFGAI